MRTIRIYQPETFNVGEIYPLSQEAGQHVGIVLRMQVGESLVLFDGANHEYQATITEVHKKRVMVCVNSMQFRSRESPRIIHLAQAIAKGERMEWIIQKAVELGVTSIRPLLTDHGAVKLDKMRLAKKCAQWQAIAVAACEQCGRNIIPAILDPINFDDYIVQNDDTIKLILDPNSSKKWREHDLQSGSIAVLIGPEGGFSLRELALATKAHFVGLYLGSRVLRTETAAIVALSLLQAVAGDL